MNNLYESAEIYGWNKLSDLELLTIVAGSKDGATALQEYLSDDNCSVEGLLKLKIDGLGKATAMKIKALYTLFRRSKRTSLKSIRHSEDLYEYFKGDLENLDHEEVWVLFMDNANHPIKKICHSTGGMNLSIIDVRMIMRKALETGKCCAMAMAHNHPSGKLTPSDQDIRSTQKVKDACKYFDIRFLDHVIISNEGFHSFSDNNLL